MILIAIILQLNSTSCGLGWTFDSNLYVQMSNEFLKKGFWKILENEMYSVKAPLFPLILSFYGMYFHLVYTLIFAGSLILGSILIAEYVLQPYLRFIGISSFVFSTPMLMIHSYLWADSIMVFLVFLLLATANHYIKKPRLRLIIILSIISALIIQIRFAGIFIVIGLLLFFSFNYKKISMKQTMMYTLITFIPFVIWLILVPEILGVRLEEYHKMHINDFANNVYVMVHALSLNLLPLYLPSFLRIAPAIFLILFIAYKNREIRQFSFPFLCMLILITYYLGIHLFFQIPMSSSEKYLTPVIPLFIIVLFHILDKLKYPRWNVFLLGACLVWLLYPLSRSVKNSVFWNAKICTENNEFNKPHNLQPVSID